MTVLRSGSATDVGRVRKVNQDLPLEACFQPTPGYEGRFNFWKDFGGYPCRSAH